MLMWKNVDVDTAILEAVIGQVDKDIFLLKVDVDTAILEAVIGQVDKDIFLLKVDVTPG